MEVVSYESFPTSNLYDGKKRMSGSWKPLKMDPGEGHGSATAPREPTQPQQRPVSSPLCISRVSWSCSSRACTLEPRSCFRMASTAARPPLRRKLKSPNQKTSSKRVVTSAGAREEGKCETRPLSLCDCSPTPGQDTPAHPQKWVAAQDPLGAQGQGGSGVGGCPQLFWVQGVTTRGAWRQTFLQVGVTADFSGLGSQSSNHSSPLNHPENEGSRRVWGRVKLLTSVGAVGAGVRHVLGQGQALDGLVVVHQPLTHLPVSSCKDSRVGPLHRQVSEPKVGACGSVQTDPLPSKV